MFQKTTFEHDLLVAVGLERYIHIWDIRSGKENIRLATRNLGSMNYITLAETYQSHNYSALLNNSKFAASGFCHQENKYSA